MKERTWLLKQERLYRELRMTDAALVWWTIRSMHFTYADMAFWEDVQAQTIRAHVERADRLWERWIALGADRCRALSYSQSY